MPATSAIAAIRSSSFANISTLRSSSSTTRATVKAQSVPSEDGCYRAADAVYEFLVTDQKRDPKQLLIYGGSLGGSVGIDLAIRKSHQAVVVGEIVHFEAPGHRRQQMVSVASGALDHAQPIPQHRQDRQTAHAHFHRLLHGDSDRAHALFEQGEVLFRAANEPKAFLRLAGQDHNESLPNEFFTELRKFLGITLTK